MRRRWLGIVAASVLLSVAAGADAKSERLTDLGDRRDYAAPLPATPAREAALHRLSMWAIDAGAIAVTFDPDTGVLSILLPKGRRAETPPSFGVDLPVEVKVARVPTRVLDAAAAMIAARDWAPEASSYAYGISINAASGTVAVDTNAPPSLFDPVHARFPGVVKVVSIPGGIQPLRDVRTRGDAGALSAGVEATLGPPPPADSGPARPD